MLDLYFYGNIGEMDYQILLECLEGIKAPTKVNQTNVIMSQDNISFPS